jgi:hypothetical protein
MGTRPSRALTYFNNSYVSSAPNPFMLHLPSPHSLLPSTDFTHALRDRVCDSRRSVYSTGDQTQEILVSDEKGRGHWQQSILSDALDNAWYLLLDILNWVLCAFLALPYACWKQSAVHDVVRLPVWRWLLEVFAALGALFVLVHCVLLTITSLTRLFLVHCILLTIASLTRLFLAALRAEFVT